MAEIVIDQRDTDIKSIKAMRSIYSNPANWEYQLNMKDWYPVPMDIGKIDYLHCFFRKKCKHS